MDDRIDRNSGDQPKQILYAKDVKRIVGMMKEAQDTCPECVLLTTEYGYPTLCQEHGNAVLTQTERFMGDWHCGACGTVLSEAESEGLVAHECPPGFNE